MTSFSPCPSSVLDDKPDTRGYCEVQFAPTGQATCKGCRCMIDQDDARIANKTDSSFHHGLDTSWYHLDCVSWGLRRLTQLANWRILSYEDQVKIRNKCGESIDEKSKDEQEMKKESELVFTIRNLVLENYDNKALKAIYEKNNIPIETKKVRPLMLAHVIADGLMHGLLDKCPGCGNNTLTQRSMQIVCEGNLSGFSACMFRGPKDAVARFNFEMPPHLDVSWIPAQFKKLGIDSPVDFEAMLAAAGVAEPEEEKPKKGKGKKGKAAAAKGKKRKKEEEEEPPAETAEAAPEAAAGSDDVDPDSLKVTELREELGNRGLETKGVKAVLVERLKEAIAAAKAAVPAKAAKAAKTEAAAEATPTTETAEEEEVDVPSLTVALLKEELKKRGVTDLSGKKADLAKRLTETLEAAKKTNGKRKAPSADSAAPTATATTPVGSASASQEASQESITSPGGTVTKRPKLAAKPKADASEKKSAFEIPTEAAEEGSEILQVDEHFPYPSDNNEVLVDADGVTVYNAMLNEVDLKTGHNRFYKLQIVDTHRKGNSRYVVWFKWGRVGEKYFHQDFLGYDNPPNCQTKEKGAIKSAVTTFADKFKDKSGNKWDDRFNFIKKPKKYNMVELSRQAVNEDESSAAIGRRLKDEKPSELVPKLQSLINLIFDAKNMQAMLEEFKIDSKKMPLGKISKSTILKGFQVLKEVETLIKEKDSKEKALIAEGKTGGLSASDRLIWESKLQEACTRFYSIVPSTVFPPISNEAQLRDKMDMMSCLVEIETANKLMSEQDKGSNKNTTDKNYESLKTNLVPVEHDSKEWDMVQRYITDTHAATHSGFSLELAELFTVERENESKIYDEFSKLHNRQLLWHGSRLTNWIGILSQGLRIAPPEAPKTGYMFGKGVYFANMVSKSANYCFTSRDHPTGIMLLSEVALGDMYEINHSEYMEKAPAGKHSTKGVGGTRPNPKSDLTMPNGCVVPYGKSQKHSSGGSLLYDEFIVYDVKQINMKYLLRINFKHHY